MLDLAGRTIDAEGRSDEASRLGSDGNRLEQLVDELEAAAPGSRASRAAGYVLDATTFAKSSAESAEAACADAACVAYIAAHAAGDLARTEGAAGEERAWQSVWLVERLGL